MGKRVRRIAAALAAALVLSCASSAPTIKVGWDEHADFSKYHTWAWKADGSIRDPVWAKRCQDVLSDQLQTDGLTQVDLSKNPDLWGVVHARLSSETVVTPFSPGWGYAWGAWAPVETYTEQVPVGTIILDLVDARQKQIVWRGRANGAIQPGKSNEEREEKLIAILKEMFAGYPPASAQIPTPPGPSR